MQKFHCVFLFAPEIEDFSLKGVFTTLADCHAFAKELTDAGMKPVIVNDWTMAHISEFALKEKMGKIHDSLVNFEQTAPALLAAVGELLAVSAKAHADTVEECQLLHLNAHNLTNKIADLLATVKSGNELKTTH